MNIDKDIKNFKQHLIRKTKKIGLWENFGQEEVNVLEDNYRDCQYRSDGVWDKIRLFDIWCQTYTGE